MSVMYKRKKESSLPWSVSSADQFTGVVSDEGLSGQIEQKPARSEGI